MVRTLTALVGELGTRSATRSTSSRPTLFRTVPLPDLSGDPPGAASRRPHRRAASTRSRPTRSTSPPKARSASPRARYCLKRGYRFTTAYHTRFPEYVAAALRRARVVDLCAAAPLPRAVARRHGGDRRRCARELAARGFGNLDALVARRRRRALPAGAARAIFSACRGRSSSTSAASRSRRTSRPSSRSTCRASKVVVGDGPQLAELRRRYPEAHFVGRQVGEDLAAPLRRAPTSSSFPAAPTPSAWCCSRRWPPACRSRPIRCPGPLDVIGDSGAGVLDEDLGRAALAALDIPREHCRAHALRFTWAASADQFVDNLWPLSGARAA